MTEMKISIPDELLEKMKMHPETNWEEIVSNAVENYIHALISRESSSKLEELKLEIEESKKILDLEKNWDGEGSIGYKEKTWNKMKAFLMKLAENYSKKYEFLIHTPFLNPGSNGAIDLHWQTNKFELLLSIPESDEVPINYYGDNYGRSSIKGTLGDDDFDVILTFMKMYH